VKLLRVSCRGDSRPPNSPSSRPTSSRRFSYFGVPAPIDVQIAGNDQLGNYNVARELGQTGYATISGAVDVHVQQAYDAPRCTWRDRTLSRQSVGLQPARRWRQQPAGLPEFQLSTTGAHYLGSIRKGGISYNVAVQDAADIEWIRVRALLDMPDPHSVVTRARDPGKPGVVPPCQPARRDFLTYNVQPLVDVFASDAGRDLRRRGARCAGP